MALTTKLGTPREICPGESPVNGQLHAGASFAVRPGALLIRRDGSTLLEPPLSAAPIFAAVVVGIYEAQCQIDATTNDDAGGGALDVNDRPILLSARCGNIGWFATGSGANEILVEHIGRPCFAFDDDTLYLTDGDGIYPFAGIVGDVRSDGRVMLQNNSAIRAMRGLFVEGGGGIPGFVRNGRVRAVITSLAANTVVDGVMTADADGALGTQDGVTDLAVGDEVLIQAGTTNLDNAEEAGPYVITALGGVSDPFVLTRPSWWAHDAELRPGSTIEVDEGTLYGGSTWKSFCAKDEAVGTDAPDLYPDYVAQQVTLAAGASTIANVPILSASKVVMSPTLIGGTPAATTTNYEKKLSSGVTAGVLGTASIIIEAQSVAGTIVNTDVSVLNVGIRNW